MAEEMGADSTESEIDMGAAQETLSSELFPESESVEEIDEEVNEEHEIEEIDEEVNKTEEVDEENIDEALKKELRAAPQSWKKEMHEKFGALDSDVQEYIETRETQMKEGLEQDRNDSNLGRTMRDTLQPFKQLLQAQGVDEAGAVNAMLTSHYKLSTSSPEVKAQLFSQLAQSYGVDLGNITQPEKVDPAIQKMQNELNGLKQNISYTQNQAKQAEQVKVSNDIKAFAEDKAHPYFDEVSNQIIAFINAGEDLDSAYEKAVWANPVTRQKEMERLQQEKAAKEAEDTKQAVEKAKKASATNIRNRNTKKAPTAPTGTMEDTMRETFRDIQSRSN